MRSALRLPAAIAVLLALLAGCSPGEPTNGSATPTRTPPPGDDPSPTPTGADGHEEIAAVVDADGRVVVLDLETGAEVRALLGGVQVDDPASNDVAMNPAGTEVFVVMPAEGGSGDSEIVRLPVDGGERETVARGTAPAVSPDGGTLAYVQLEEPAGGEDQAGLPDPVVVLRDLGSGEESRLTRQEPFHFIADVAWSADGGHVVFTAGEIYTGLYAVDREARSLDEARRLGPDLQQQSDATSWGPVAAFGDSELAVVETCCDPPTEERWTIIAVEVADGATDGTPLLQERLEATHLDSDAGAENLLIVVRGGPDGGQLLRWDGAGDPEPIAEGIVAAAW